MGYDGINGEVLSLLRARCIERENLQADGRYAYTTTYDESTDFEKLSMLMERLGNLSFVLNRYHPELKLELYEDLIDAAAIIVSWAERVKYGELLDKGKDRFENAK